VVFCRGFAVLFARSALDLSTLLHYERRSMNRFSRNIRSRGADVFPDGEKSSGYGERKSGFTNFGREANCFRREPARAFLPA
jgi:hypothetical protein